MKFLEIVGLVFLIILALSLIPTLLEIVLGFFIAALVITTVVGVLSIPFGLVFLFWRWFYNTVTAPAT